MKWNQLLRKFENAHFLQTYEWAQIKAPFGWQPEYAIWRARPQGAFAFETLHVDGTGELPDQPFDSVAGAALVLRRALPVAGFAARLQVMYVPKGPLLDWSNEPLRRQALADLAALGRKRGAIFVKIDPDLPTGWGLPGEAGAHPDPAGEAVLRELVSSGWRYSDEQVQFRNTVLIDLEPQEEALLARMKQKTRYNIRLAARRGVTVRPAGLEDLDLLFDMYVETAVRDQFVIRDRPYYRLAWGTLMKAGLAEPLIAEVDGQPVAGVVVVRFGRQAWYYNGMSRQEHREKMPNYLLQWEAMRRARAAGCRVYDLWGAPDTFDEGDPMWGVYRFKEGLGGQVVRYAGAYDYPIRGTLYRLYTRTLPRLLDFLRAQARSRARRSLPG